MKQQLFFSSLVLGASAMTAPAGTLGADGVFTVMVYNTKTAYTDCGCGVTGIYTPPWSSTWAAWSSTTGTNGGLLTSTTSTSTSMNGGINGAGTTSSSSVSSLTTSPGGTTASTSTTLSAVTTSPGGTTAITSTTVTTSLGGTTATTSNTNNAQTTALTTSLSTLTTSPGGTTASTSSTSISAVLGTPTTTFSTISTSVSSLTTLSTISTTTSSSLSSTSSSSTSSGSSTTTSASTTATTSASTTSSSASSTTASSGAVVTDAAYISTVLRHHNFHRSNHTSDPLNWSASLAEAARVVAQSCKYGHNTTANGGNYGQNIGAGYLSTNMGDFITGGLYNGEVNFYTYFGGEPDFSQLGHFGHFSAIVWKATTTVGCFTADCSATGLTDAETGQPLNGIAPFFSVCNYQQTGNVVGQFAANVLKSVGLPTIQPNFGCPSNVNCVA